jgi:hypothetical protein
VRLVVDLGDVAEREGATAAFRLRLASCEQHTSGNPACSNDSIWLGSIAESRASGHMA